MSPAGALGWLALAVTLAVVAAGCTSVRSAPVPPPAPAPSPAPPRLMPAPAKKEPPPLLSPQVSGEEETRLTREARGRIEDAEKVVGRIDPTRLARAQQETLATIQDFLAKARAAIIARDVQRALTLAEKALALAHDLSGSPR